MKMMRSLLTAAFCVLCASILWAAQAEKQKNWTPAVEKIPAQALADVAWP